MGIARGIVRGTVRGVVRGLVRGIDDGGLTPVLPTTTAYWTSLSSQYDAGSNAQLEQAGNGVGDAQLGSSSVPNINSPERFPWYDPNDVDFTEDGVDYKIIGSERLTNPSFETDTDWTKGAGWTIGGGAASCDGTTFTALSQSVSTFTTGSPYLVEVEVDVTSGNVRLFLFGSILGPDITVSGTYRYVVYATTGTDSLQVQSRSPGFDGSVPNVSVREVAVAAGDHLALPGTAGNYAVLPYFVGQHISGDQHFVGCVDYNIIVGAQVILSNRAFSTIYEFRTVSSGKVGLLLWDSLGVQHTYESPSTAAKRYVCADVDADDGAGNTVVYFWESDTGEGGTWTTLGSDTNATSGAVKTAGTPPTYIGAFNASGGNTATGKQYSSYRSSGRLGAGTKVLHWRAEDMTQDGGTDNAGAGNWTINYSATGAPARLITQDLGGGHTDDYYRIAANANLPTNGYLYNYWRDIDGTKELMVDEVAITDAGFDILANERFGWLGSAVTETQLDAGQQAQLATEFQAILGGRTGD